MISVVYLLTKLEIGQEWAAAGKVIRGPETLEILDVGA